MISGCRDAQQLHTLICTSNLIYPVLPGDGTSALTDGKRSPVKVISGQAGLSRLGGGGEVGEGGGEGESGGSETT